MLPHVGKNGSILTNLNSFTYRSYVLGMSEEKIKIKAGRLLLFIVRDNFYMSEDSLTVKYSESGLIKKLQWLKKPFQILIFKCDSLWPTHVRSQTKFPALNVGSFPSIVTLCASRMYSYSEWSGTCRISTPLSSCNTIYKKIVPLECIHTPCDLARLIFLRLYLHV